MAVIVDDDTSRVEKSAALASGFGLEEVSSLSSANNAVLLSADALGPLAACSSYWSQGQIERHCEEATTGLLDPLFTCLRESALDDASYQQQLHSDAIALTQYFAGIPKSYSNTNQGNPPATAVSLLLQKVAELVERSAFKNSHCLQNHARLGKAAYVAACRFKQKLEHVRSWSSHIGKIATLLQEFGLPECTFPDNF